MNARWKTAPLDSSRSDQATIRGVFSIHHVGPVLFFLLLLALLKLALITNREIIASDSPHDSFWHILAALHWMWGREYSEWTLMHLPVYPLFIAVTGSIGVPLRLTTELFYMGGAATLIFALGRLGLPRAIQIVSFALIVFHPYSFATLDHALAEILYACLMLFFVAFFVRLMVPMNQRDFFWSAFLFAGTTALYGIPAKIGAAGGGHRPQRFGDYCVAAVQGHQAGRRSSSCACLCGGSTRCGFTPWYPDFRYQRTEMRTLAH